METECWIVIDVETLLMRCWRLGVTMCIHLFRFCEFDNLSFTMVCGVLLSGEIVQGATDECCRNEILWRNTQNVFYHRQTVRTGTPLYMSIFTYCISLNTKQFVVVISTICQYRKTTTRIYKLYEYFRYSNVGNTHFFLPIKSNGKKRPDSNVYH